MTAATGRDAGTLVEEELRSLFLFERLDDEQLRWVAKHARVREHAEGDVLYAEGEPAQEFFVLLDGEVVLSQRVRDGEVEIVRTSYRGAYAGAVQAVVRERMAQVYLNTARLPVASRFLVLPGAAFADALRAWYPLPIHLLEGLWLARQNLDTVVGQRERLLALGQLSAGLTHELNNPAAAAVRATAALRERVAGMRHKLGLLARGEIDGEQLQRLTTLQETLVERAAKAPRLSPLETADREDELGDWLEDAGVSGGHELAPVYVAAGLDVACADEIADAVAPEFLESALRWLAYTLETEALMREIEDATGRISTLLADVRQYSRMDRTPYEPVDLREGLESTLAILAHKIGPGVTVVRDLDPALPPVPAYGGELNQVWTNLIDNALGAMGGEGTLTVRTHRQEDSAVVEIGDDGPGVPEELQQRIFEPFFTTKPVGQGTGLGLDISYRIVVSRHRGDLAVRSVPGDTRFVVRLPLHPPGELGQASYG